MSSLTSTTTGGEVVKYFSSEIKGKTFVITGTSEGGLGAQTALSLAHAQPAEILLLGRTESKVQPVISQLAEISPSIKTCFIPIDLADLSSVRAAAKSINSKVSKIDVLINNAGIMAVKEYTKTKDGFESQFGANHIGHFLLTNLLVEKIANGGRIINLTSMGYESEEIRFDDYNFQDGKTYNPWLAYGQSKTANILFGVALTKKLKSKSISAFAVHPGLILGTNLLANVTPDMFADGFKVATEKNDGKPVEMEAGKTLEAGCSTTLVAALDPAIVDKSGGLLTDCGITKKPVKAYAQDPEKADRLWELSEKLVGQTFNY